MSYDELQQVWNDQTAPPIDTTEARNWMMKTRRSYLGKTALVSIGVAAGILTLIPKLAVIAYDSEHTFTNSAFDFMVGVGVFLCAMFGLYQYVKERREFDALGNDLNRCLEMLIESTRREIRGISFFVPLAYLGFSVLIVLSKLQSIGAGHESPTNAWSRVVFAIVVMVIATAFMFYRANTFLKPRLETLKNAQRTFE